MCPRSPWLSQTDCGEAICQFDVAPPASDSRARATSAAEVGWRRRNTASWPAMSSSSRESAVGVGTVARLMPASFRWPISRRSRCPSCDAEKGSEGLTERSVYVSVLLPGKESGPEGGCVPDYDQRDGINSAAGAPRRSTPIRRRSVLRGLALRCGGRPGPHRDAGGVRIADAGRCAGQLEHPRRARARRRSRRPAAPSASSGPSGGLQIASPDNPVTWPIYDDNPVIEDNLQPEKNAVLRLYNYADYIDPGAIKAFEKKYQASTSRCSCRPSTTPTRR